MEPEKTKYPLGEEAPINIDKLRHPSEHSRFILAEVTIIIIGVVLVVYTILTYGILLLALGLLVLGAWIATEILKAHLVGSSIRVSEENFPQVHSVVEQIKRKLGYHESVGVMWYKKEKSTLFYTSYLV